MIRGGSGFLPRIDVAGVLIDNVTTAETTEAIVGLIAAGGPACVVTPNVDHIVKVRRDPEFAEICRTAALVLADGMPLLWAARFLGTPLKEKISGSDLFPELCALSARKGYGVFFLGGRPGAANVAAEQLTARYPGLRVVGTCCPPFGFEHDQVWNEQIIAMVRSARPHILFLALGTPKQEKWIRRHQAACGVPVAIGVGASVDFVAGVVRRAPRWMQRAGLEWLWRLLQEPRRLWRRYLVEDPKFFWYVARQRFRVPATTPPRAHRPEKEQ